jgi:hypothetical protein
MSTHVEARFEVTGWDETPLDDGVGVSKLTEALVSKKYTGDVDGTSTTKWLMAYQPDKSASYVGIERMQGTVGGKRGGLVLLHDGAFEDGGRHRSPARRVRDRPAQGRHRGGQLPGRPGRFGDPRSRRHLICPH